VKKQNDVSGPYATAALADDHGDTKDQPFHEIVPDGFSIPSLDVLERKEMLPLLAQHIAQLPLASKKLLAMYYYENLPHLDRHRQLDRWWSAQRRNSSCRPELFNEEVPKFPVLRVFAKIRS